MIPFGGSGTSARDSVVDPDTMHSTNSTITLTLLSLLLLITTDNVYARTRLNGAMLRSYFGCPACDLNECPPLQGTVEDGCIPVKESGICGCCMLCARLEHQNCGIYTSKCAPGLKCRPIENLVDKESEFYSLWEGQGVCMSVAEGTGK